MKIFILFLLSFIYLFSNSMDKYINEHNNLNTFNYQEYLTKISFSDIEKLEEDRVTANKKNLGNTFLYNLTDIFINTYPSSMSNIEDRIELGENFLKYHSKENKEHTLIYSYIGYYILSNCSQSLEKDISNNSDDWFFFFQNFSKIKRLKIQLSKSNIFIKSKKHNAKKLIDNIRYGQFSYIWNRIYLKYFYVPETTKASQLSLQAFTTNNIEDNTISYLLNNNEKIGEIIWLEKLKYKMHYLSQGNIKKKYDKFLLTNKRKPRISLTGGFLNDHGNPEGFTIENGQIVNMSLMPNRDALILIENDGTSHVINLKEGTFTLPNKEKINPLKYASDYAKLTNWAQTNQASVFQTQLLAFNNKLLIKPNKLRYYIRERRLILIVNNPKNNKVFHIIANIREAVDLSLITKKIFELIKAKKYNVEAILNLDVGSYNIMEVYDSNGSIILDSKLPLLNSKNLLFYTQ